MPPVLLQTAQLACGAARASAARSAAQHAAVPLAASSPRAAALRPQLRSAHDAAPHARAARCCRRRALPPRAAAAAAADLDQLLRVAVEAADAGAGIVRLALDLPRNVEYKGEMDLVTECVCAIAQTQRGALSQPPSLRLASCAAQHRQGQ